jgi:hypothetical protein
LDGYFTINKLADTGTYRPAHPPPPKYLLHYHFNPNCQTRSNTLYSRYKFVGGKWRDEIVNETDNRTRLISLSEASEIYGFSHNYLRNLARKGRLSAKKIAGAWLTTPENMEDFIQSRQERGVFRDDIEASD